jgi:hypothetical protein
MKSKSIKEVKEYYKNRNIKSIKEI